MTTTVSKTAQEAFDDAYSPGHEKLIGTQATFVCPFPDCGVVTQHTWGTVERLIINTAPSSIGQRQYFGDQLVTSVCPACQHEVLFLAGEMIWPRTSDAPHAAPDLPPSLVADFEEARAICRDSPRGAAALLRLLIQKLCLELGAKQPDINSAIGAFVAEGRISPAIQRALDAVRVIGNEAVHPGTMDLSDDRATVNSLFGLINFVVEKMITEPREIDAIYNSLPAGKLAGIAQRDS